jgi:lipoate-protein ligase A
MYLLISNSTDPYTNLATEEFLLKNTTDDIIFLYINQACIIAGKHQNVMAEVNYHFVQENNIPVIRRISGGGTVYHDLGNVNFTFIQNGEEGKLINFKAFISPVCEFLKSKGVPAEIGPRNDILIEGLKVSGNAEHIYKKRTLHHGTLLFSSALNNLGSALHVDAGKYTDRAVKSVRSKVTNINTYYPENISTSEFFELLSDYLSSFYNASPLILSEEAVAQIKTATVTKYQDWQWNYGYSPDYIFRNTVKLGTFQLNIELSVEKGIIKKALINSNLDEKVLNELQELLINQQHSLTGLMQSASISLLEKITGINNKEIAWIFF